MVKVIIRRNREAKSVIVPDSTIVKTVIEESGMFDWHTGSTHMNSVVLKVDDFSKSFAQLGFNDGEVMIVNVAKTNNACSDELLEKLIHNDDFFSEWVNK